MLFKAKKLRSALIILILVSLCSCATTVRSRITRPAEIDLNGAQGIAVLPFTKSQYFPYYNNTSSNIINSYYNTYSRVSAVEAQVLNHIKNEIERRLQNSPYLYLVSSVAVNNALLSNKPNPADVYITGEMVTFNIYDNESVEKKLVPEKETSVNNNTENTSTKNDKKDPVYVYEKKYTREVLAIFNYQIIEGNTDKVLYFDTVKVNEKSGVYKDLQSLPNPYSMIITGVDNFIVRLFQGIQPYSVDKVVTLLEDKNKNPDMKYANSLAKDGYLKNSYDKYLSIYDSLHIFEAGYNAAILLMSMGDLKGAEALMDKVYQETGNSKAWDALYDIKNEIKLAQKLEKQLNNYENESNKRNVDTQISEK